MTSATILGRAYQTTNFDILAEASEWIVIYKSAGMLSHPTKPGGPYTLWHGLQELLAFELVNGGCISLINRLDRETSGIVLVGKTPEMASLLAQAMASGKIYKEYLAIVLGWPPNEDFEVSHPILRQGEVMESSVWLKRTVHPAGASAQTIFRVERRLLHPVAGKISFVRAMPITGRTHQIRVHLSSAGYPVIGDKIYGPDPEYYLRFIAEGWSDALQASLYLPRHALHSARMEVNTQNFQAVWECPMPDDMKKFLKMATIYSEERIL